GSPVWKAGKKTFAWVHADRNLQTNGGRSAKGGRPRLHLYFWVGVAAQGLMTADKRFHIPAYMGHNGWIALGDTDECDWDEVRGLALGSYRHFALQRMLRALDTKEEG